jgi:predicted nucleic acid-binding protein
MVASMSGRRIYLDTNVFIAAYEDVHARSEHAWRILRAIDDGEFVGVTSELTLAEFLVRPFEEQDYDRVQHYQEIISPAEGFDVATVNRAVLIEAATLRATRKSLRLPDAIHVATARLNECGSIVSDDRRLPSPPGLQFIQLGPNSLTAIRNVRA